MNMEGNGFDPIKENQKPISGPEQIFDHEAKERHGERSTAEIFASLMNSPMSPIGTERVIESFSIRPNSERN